MDLICGINPVIEALSAGRRHFDRLLVVKGLRNRRVSEAITRASHIGVPLRFETRETLDRLAAGVPHQGVIAVVSPKPAIGLEELLSGAHDPALLVVLDGVEDPRNLGAILRTVEGAGADGVLLPERHSAGLSETVNRASAGALEHVKVARIGNVSQSFDTLKARGVWVIGLDASGERWDKIDFKRPIALVLGGEGRGLRRLTRERCDQLAALPLFGHVTSLNVSVAAGAVLYEVVRQRGAAPSHVKPISPPVRPSVPTHVVGPGPDDGEVDPGWLGPTDGDAAPPDSEDDALPTSLSIAQIHEDEDAAWRVHEVAAASERRTPRPHGDSDRERRPRRDERPRGRAPEPAPSEGAGGERSAEGPHGKRRRRRRGRRPNGAGEPAEPRPLAAGPPAEGAAEPTGEAAVPPANGAEGPGGEKRRGRRRRRRRH